MVCVDITDESVSLYKQEMKNWDWTGIDEVHFVHGFQLVKYTDTFYMVSYPQEDDHAEIEKSINEILGTLEKEIFIGKGAPKIVNEVLFSTEPRSALVEYSDQNDIDEMVIGTRGKHGITGLFSSSFAEYMVRHAHCTLRVIREKK